jgi:hypothetical protein
MRFIGLTLCLLASSLGARAESVEDRVVALEARVKALEEALHSQPAKPAAVNVDGTYKAAVGNGKSITVVFDKGKVTANIGDENKLGTYEVAGDRVIVTADGKSEILTIDGDRLTGKEGDNKIEFVKTK